jgi:F-type H+-transporting ATPase subunit delta
MYSVARRYAKALFESALEQDKLNNIAIDVKLLNDMLKSDREFKFFLANPLINDKKKRTVVADTFKNKLDDLTYNFLLLSAEKKRINLLKDILQQFNQFVLMYNNQIEGELISAVNLSQAQENEIKSKVERMTGKSIVFTSKIDNSILGGFIVKFENKILDYSIRNQLDSLRSKFVSES